MTTITAHLSGVQYATGSVRRSGASQPSVAGRQMRAVTSWDEREELERLHAIDARARRLAGLAMYRDEDDPSYPTALYAGFQEPTLDEVVRHGLTENPSNFRTIAQVLDQPPHVRDMLLLTPFWRRWELPRARDDDVLDETTWASWEEERVRQTNEARVTRAMGPVRAKDILPMGWREEVLARHAGDVDGDERVLARQLILKLLLSAVKVRYAREDSRLLAYAIDHQMVTALQAREMVENYHLCRKIRRELWWLCTTTRRPWMRSNSRRLSRPAVPPSE